MFSVFYFFGVKGKESFGITHFYTRLSEKVVKFTDNAYNILRDYVAFETFKNVSPGKFLH